MAAVAIDVAVLFGVLVMMLVGLGYKTSYDSYFLFIRIGILALMCIATIMASSAVSKGIRVSSVSTLMWRSVRETASDESAYEQIAAINRANKLMFTGRNDLNTSSMLMVLCIILTVILYIVGILSSEGYL